MNDTVRASLLGPALGAIAVGYGQSTLSEKWPNGWIYLLGLLFMLVPWLLPGGIASIGPKISGLFQRGGDAGEPATGESATEGSAEPADVPRLEAAG